MTYKTEPVQIALLEQGEYTGYLGAAEDISIGDVVGLFDIQDASLIMKEQNVEKLLLSRVQALHLTAIKYHIKDAHLIDSNIGVCIQFSISPDSLCEPGKCGGCLSNSPVDFSVQGEVISNGRVKIGEFMDYLQVDGDDGGSVLGILAQYFGLLQTEFLTGL
ncbi:Hypothetical predicted protein [Octopus vulgaris]|uniref:Uncharacterized protein n=1 Tax=Octopus vulgaris TaxID=6645 RepID=A0AA36FEE7_OCTVU|nr:Hypothetical predicted protein [Octopus vulgaris]